MSWLRRPRVLAALGGMVLGFALGALVIALVAVGENQQSVALEERAERVATKAAQDEVKEQVGGEIASEVQDQLDERLVPTVDLPPRSTTGDSSPFDLKPDNTTTTEASGPFDLTTTTLPAEPPVDPPIDPPPTTIPEVPTTVTIPEVPLP